MPTFPTVKFFPSFELKMFCALDGPSRFLSERSRSNSLLFLTFRSELFLFRTICSLDLFLTFVSRFWSAAARRDLDLLDLSGVDGAGWGSCVVLPLSATMISRAIAASSEINESPCRGVALAAIVGQLMGCRSPRLRQLGAL